MLACVLLAAMLGGIAMANPDALTGGDGSTGGARGGASHGGGTAAHERGDDRDGDDIADDHGGGATHDVADCRAMIRHLRDDAGSGHHAGLTQSIEVVSDNCREHLQAPGLLRALERLIANAERWEERHGDGPGKAGDPPGQTNGHGSNGGNGHDSNPNGSNGGNGSKGSNGGSTSSSGGSSAGGSGGSGGGSANPH